MHDVRYEIILYWSKEDQALVFASRHFDTFLSREIAVGRREFRIQA
jgi:hypothetical protein